MRQKQFDDGSTRFLEGLRGIAALCVYIEHFTIITFPRTRYGYRILDDEAHEDNSPFQLPVIRILFSGTLMVYIFFIISGYVLCLRAFEHAKAGSYDLALCSVSSTFLRRLYRLYYPVIVSSCIVMLAVPLGIFDITSRNFNDNTKSVVARPHRPQMQNNIWYQYIDWCDYTWSFLLNVWAWPLREPKSNYGAHLWTIPAFIRCSMTASIASISLCRFRPIYCLLILSALICFCVVSNQDQGALTLFGVLLARMHVEREPQQRVASGNNYIPPQTLISETGSVNFGNMINDHWKHFSPSLTNSLQLTCRYVELLLGVYLGSFPEFHIAGEGYSYGYPKFLMAWRRGLHYTLGASMIVDASYHLRPVQSLLSTSIPQYFGSISFSLYIVHEPLLQMFGWNLVVRARTAAFESASWLMKAYVIGLCWISVTATVIWSAAQFRRWIEVPSSKYAKWIEYRLIEASLPGHDCGLRHRIPSDAGTINNYGSGFISLLAVAPFLILVPGFCSLLFRAT